ncbi:MAG: signal peptidase II [Acidimicrobiales bacterium]|nr:signal peptidase II [Acidimicrobiales bacterium]HLV89944.1 signal peptidase II [Acidimicrobiia bacterium]
MCLPLQLIRRLALPLVIAAAVVVADQATKRMAESLFSDRRVWVIDGFFGFTFHENPGAAFSLFGRGGPFFAVVAILVSAFVIWYLRTPRPMPERIGFGLVLGGALGNLFDRLTRGDGLFDGKVVDWINLWWIPTFNIADASLTIAVVLLLVYSWRTRNS